MSAADRGWAGDRRERDRRDTVVCGDAGGRAMSVLFTMNLTECREVAQVGGKAANLGRLLRAGFPVPGGFVVTTAAFRAASGTGLPPGVPTEVAAAICEGYRAMGMGLVAVRSSATAEDLADASMAGQYETVLNIEGEEAL